MRNARFGPYQNGVQSALEEDGKGADFFLFNQQSIIQNTRADHGSYFITMYKTSKLHEERNRKKKKN